MWRLYLAIYSAFWAPIASFMEACEDTDGDEISEIPQKYDSYEGRKEVIDSWNMGDLLKNPNRFFWRISGIILATIVLVAGLIMGIVKSNQRLRKRKIKG